MLNFTKIKWAGQDCILIADSKDNKRAVLILNEYQIKQLNEEFKNETRRL